MSLTERAEEIMESLWIELIEKGNNSCDTGLLRDDEALEELVETGHVTISDNRLTMTGKGRKEAGNCIRRHRLAERLFADVFDVKGGAVHEKSCRFEHMLQEGLDENICTLLGHPTTCPHGKPIPEGRCCRSRKAPKKVIMPLTDLGKNRETEVSYLRTRDRSSLQKMIAMGILPRTKISLIQKFPSYVIQVGKSQFAIDKELAGEVFVRNC